MRYIDPKLLIDKINYQIEVDRGRLEQFIAPEDTAELRGRLKGLRFVLREIEDLTKPAEEKP